MKVVVAVAMAFQLGAPFVSIHVQELIRTCKSVSRRYLPTYRAI